MGGVALPLSFSASTGTRPGWWPCGVLSCKRQYDSAFPAVLCCTVQFRWIIRSSALTHSRIGGSAATSSPTFALSLSEPRWSLTAGALTCSPWLQASSEHTWPAYCRVVYYILSCISCCCMLACTVLCGTYLTNKLRTIKIVLAFASQHVTLDPQLGLLFASQ